MDGHIVRQINLYVEEQRKEVYIISTGCHDLLGIVEINYVEKLQLPLDKTELYKKVQLCFDRCYSKVPPAKPAKESALATRLNKKSYSEATRNKKLISVLWRENLGYTIYPTKKEKRMGYSELTDKGITLGEELTEKSLYETVLEAIQLSSA